MRPGVIGPPATLPDAAAAAVALGRERDFEEAAAATRGGEPWVRAGLAYVEHDFTRAADLYREIGTVPDEADARLRAAQQAIEGGRRAEGERELERALALWRSLAATAYVLEAKRCSRPPLSCRSAAATAEANGGAAARLPGSHAS